MARPSCLVLCLLPTVVLAGCGKIIESQETSPILPAQHKPIVDKRSENISANDPISEMNFERIHPGMSHTAVEAILGRPPDRTIGPGGSLGDEWCFWQGERATVFVKFSLLEGMTVADKTFTKK